MTVERKRFCRHFLAGTKMLLLSFAMPTVPKPNRPQHLYMQTETGFRMESETGLDKWNTA